MSEVQSEKLMLVDSLKEMKEVRSGLKPRKTWEDFLEELEDEKESYDDEKI